MASFAQSFWSSDYAGGLGVLFGKLQQGVKENQQILTIARMRADAEELYGQHIADIETETDRIHDGFSKDDGASVRKAYEGVRVEMSEAASKHKKIAQNIRELVVYPFGRWCDQHAVRVQASQDELQSRVKSHDRQADAVRKLRSNYFNKCRLVEDLEEEDKFAFKEPHSAQSNQSSPKIQTPTVKVQEPDNEEEPEPIEIGDQVYQPEQVKRILQTLLENIHLKDVKVPILGVYQNATSGADITDYIQKNLGGTSTSYAERIGQDLISHGYLRLIGSVGNTFMNSSRMNYQWRPKAFEMAGIDDPKKLGRAGTAMSIDSFDSPLVGTAKELIAGWNPLNNPHPNETPPAKLRREAREADERYKIGVRKLDLLRCQLEEAMFEHFKFMERCELDRLRAIKSVILDFSGALSNVIPSLQSTVDKMMLFQETVQPLGDLRYILENYRVGTYNPKVPVYENYYNSINDQIFGVDVEARGRADKKRVPTIVSSVLTFLDNRYPLLDGDEARRAIWVVDVPLAATHRLREEIINSPTTPHIEIFERYEVPIVASLLKIYLLELPDSLVPTSLYEIIKAIYSSTDTSSAPETRVSILQNTLGQLRLINIATLDAITTHFSRLLDLTSADEAYMSTLTKQLAPCLLRQRADTALSFEEKYSLRFVRDLLDHKDAIFGELKRNIAAGKHHQTSLGPSASVYRANSTIAPLETVTAAVNRPRAISTDESNRRAHMEERQRAIAQNNRSRNGSPAPGRESGDKHTLVERRPPHSRQESSRGNSETRFPVHVSTSSISSTRVTPRKNSGATLEVPGTPPSATSSSLQSTPTASTYGPSSSLAQHVTSVTPPLSDTATPDAVPEPVDLSALSFEPPPLTTSKPGPSSSVAPNSRVNGESDDISRSSSPANTNSNPTSSSVADRINSLQRRAGAEGSRKRKAAGLRTSGLSASSGSAIDSPASSAAAAASASASAAVERTHGYSASTSASAARKTGPSASSIRHVGSASVSSSLMTGSVVENGNAGENGQSKRGVELVDRPVDLD